MGDPVSPMEITCPRCGRLPGERCRTEGGMVIEAVKTHSARRRAAELASPAADPITRLAAKLDGRWDAIVGIPRGGLVVAAGLGYALAIDNVSALSFRYLRRPGRVDVGKLLAEPVDVFGERVLLVEDGTDTGTLLTAGRRYLEERYAAEVTTAALWVKRAAAFRPDVWVEEVDVLPSARELLAAR